MRLIAAAAVLAVASSPAAAAAPEGIVATFSIVARDPATGALGCAVQSRYFAVGAVVCWGEPDVGIIATQANVNVGYGPQGLALLRQGLSAEAVLKRVRAEDSFPGVEGRQLAIIDARGGIAVYTGPEALDWAGHRKGASYSAQGNILASESVVAEMARAFESSTASFPERLVAALAAGQAAGGDRRGQQSAALLVVEKGAGRNINNDVAVRLHVDDDPQPIDELGRLLGIQLAMGAMQDSRRLQGDGEANAAMAAARRAVELWPAGAMTHTTLGLLAYSNGDQATALRALRQARELNPQFEQELDSILRWTNHPGLSDEFRAQLFARD